MTIAITISQNFTRLVAADSAAHRAGRIIVGHSSRTHLQHSWVAGRRLLRSTLGWDLGGIMGCDWNRLRSRNSGSTSKGRESRSVIRRRRRCRLLRYFRSVFSILVLHA